MKKVLKIIVVIVNIIVLSIIIDLICIFTINRPLFAVKVRTPYTYIGIFYNTYNCPEYSVPQIKAKGTKFTCAVSRVDIGKVTEIVDMTKLINDFACAEILEQFYEDDNYDYYYDCMKGKYIIVRYESGYEETVENALKYGTITISDLDKYNISYIKYEKENN